MSNNLFGSGGWYQDREGDLPDGVKAGILPEDLVHDELRRSRDIFLQDE